MRSANAKGRDDAAVDGEDEHSRAVFYSEPKQRGVRRLVSAGISRPPGLEAGTADSMRRHNARGSE